MILAGISREIGLRNYTNYAPPGSPNQDVLYNVDPSFRKRLHNPFKLVESTPISDGSRSHDRCGACDMYSQTRQQTFGRFEDCSLLCGSFVRIPCVRPHMFGNDFTMIPIVVEACDV